MSCGCGPCVSCRSNPCRCRSKCSTPAVPVPSYAQGCCPEQHCSPQLVPAYAALKVNNSFVMPACGQAVSLEVSNLLGLPVGSYIWNVGVGYLKVVSVNLLDGTILAQNDCTSGNLAGGTSVAACTEFVVTATPPVSGSNPGQSGIFVAIDFTAPEIGDCINITLTAVTGLAAGKNVQIGSGTYRLNAIISSTIVEICNDGAGIAPNSPVIAKNGSGQYQYPVTLIDVNACTNPPVTEGILTVCVDGVASPLAPATPGQVPIAQDTEGNVKFMTLDVPTRTCTTITCCLTLVPGVLQYIIPVADSSEFTVGDVFQIGTRTDRWTVDAIIDGTHIQATTDTDPGAVQEIAPATSLCLVDCCEDLQIQLNELACAPVQLIGNIPLSFYSTTVSLDPDGYYSVTLDSQVPVTESGNVLDLNTLNICHEANYQVIAHVSVALLPDFLNGAFGTFIYHEVEVEWDNGAFPALSTCGKIVYTDSFSDGKDLVGFPPTTDTVLFNQLISAAPRFPMMYHQQDVDAMAILSGTDSAHLQLFYRTLVGDNFPPSSYFNVQFMISGWLELRRS